MKQIIPFKKELLFKTKVSEITSISLEHTLDLKSDDLISGKFHISGDYKMTEGSINRESFSFELPFDIALDARYDMSSIVIDIDNFYYEIVNNEVLQVNIDVYVEGVRQEEEPIIEEKKEVIVEDKIKEEETREVFSSKDEDIRLDKEEAVIDAEYSPSVELKKADKIIIEPKIEVEQDNSSVGDVSSVTINNNEFNIFENIDNADTYVTYYVYVVKEGDTIDKILEKYSVTKEEVANYNNLEKVSPGTKLIIPSKINE